MAARQVEGSYEKNVFKYFVVCKGGRATTSRELTRGTVFQEIRPGAGSKPSISLKRSRGGGAHCTSTSRLIVDRARRLDGAVVTNTCGVQYGIQAAEGVVFCSDIPNSARQLWRDEGYR